MTSLQVFVLFIAAWSVWNALDRTQRQLKRLEERLERLEHSALPAAYNADAFHDAPGDWPEASGRQDR